MFIQVFLKCVCFEDVNCKNSAWTHGFNRSLSLDFSIPKNCCYEIQNNWRLFLKHTWIFFKVLFFSIMSLIQMLIRLLKAPLKLLFFDTIHRSHEMEVPFWTLIQKLAITEDSLCGRCSRLKFSYSLVRMCWLNFGDIDIHRLHNWFHLKRFFWIMRTIHSTALLFLKTILNTMTPGHLWLRRKKCILHIMKGLHASILWSWSYTQTSQPLFLFPIPCLKYAGWCSKIIRISSRVRQLFFRGFQGRWREYSRYFHRFFPLK